ncbi:tyrosine-type recombinase/integrase [Methanococcoides orientis]|uniref:tyrosine-type recombinase/integrase n=1 Tax=Methanococcoides orientis TaxID=2822137 RepID=UPI001E39A9CA|nr:site-specific integrase [Methanococcoides orientis]UGV40259.1 tyrosine-type recombinase/integrase [Methanococcoides orientis]
MTQDVDDVHKSSIGFTRAMERLKNADIGEDNIDLIERFVLACRREGLAKTTLIWYVDYSKRTAEYLRTIDIEKRLDQLDQDDFDRLLIYLEDEKNLTAGGIRNHKKLIKKLFRWAYDGEPPKWIAQMTLKAIETPVQPSDLLTRDELDKLLDYCNHPRDKALIAVLADSGMRIGALASCRIKNVEFNQYGAILYISKTSKSKKSTAAKGIPITWSTGYLNQWLSVHPFKEDHDAPLWVTLDKNRTPLSYKTARTIIVKIGGRAGIKKPVNPHSFRHLAITNWILDGLNEQEIKHRAGWSRGSTQMFKIYANFTDNEINDRIFEKYGLKTKDKRHVTLKACPRCNNVLRPEDKFCSQCSLVLNREALGQIQECEQVIPELLQLALNTDAGKKLLAKMQ